VVLKARKIVVNFFILMKETQNGAGTLITTTIKKIQ